MMTRPRARGDWLGRSASDGFWFAGHATQLTVGGPLGDEQVVRAADAGIEVVGGRPAEIAQTAHVEHLAGVPSGFVRSNTSVA